MFIEVFFFTLDQDGQKSGGAMPPPVWKVEGPLAPLPPPPGSAAYAKERIVSEGLKNVMIHDQCSKK